MPTPTTVMRRKTLEMALARLEDTQAKDPRLEQYSTPAPIAADILFRALHRGDIDGGIVGDLGCGNGIFAIGAALLGSEKVIAVDSDEGAVATAQRNAELLGVADIITFITADVSAVTTPCDTVIQNPPFGAQKRKADRPFLEKAMELAPVVHSLHISETIPFIRTLVAARGGAIVYQRPYIFPIQHAFSFHTKERVDVTVSLIIIERTEG